MEHEIMGRIQNRIKTEITGVKEEMRERTLGYILTAFGLVAGLAWNDAVKSFIEYVFPADHTGNTLKAKFIYAVIITTVVVLVSAYLSRLSRKNKDGKKEEKEEAGSGKEEKKK